MGDVKEALEGLAITFADIYQRANFSQSFAPEAEENAAIPPEEQAARSFGAHLSRVREWVEGAKSQMGLLRSKNVRLQKEIDRLERTEGGTP